MLNFGDFICVCLLEIRFMGERDEIIRELKHFVRYYHQAAHEFFDDTSSELQERLEAFYGCLEQNQNSLEEYRKMVEFLVVFERTLKQRVEDLTHLTNQMARLLEAPK